MLPDGVYLNLPEAIYRADQALGYTDHKQLLTAPQQWWFRSPHNPHQVLKDDEKTTVFMQWGRVVETLLLEPDRFDQVYCCEPERPEGLLKTKQEIGDALRLAGLPVPVDGKGVPKMPRDELLSIARVKGLAVLDDWNVELEQMASGRELISRSWWNSLRVVEVCVRRHSKAQHAIKDGRSQVSMIWTDADGIRCKLRLDYLKYRRGNAAVLDLKTYSLREGKDPVEAFLDACDTFAYDMQVAHYHDAMVEHFPRLVADGAVFDGGDPAELDGTLGPPAEDDLAFLRDVAAVEKPLWQWLTVSGGAVPEVDLIDFPLGGIIHGAAQSKIRQARRNYLENVEKFGLDTPWVADRGLVQLDDMSFRQSIINRGSQKWTSL